MARPLLALVALDRAGLPDTDETLRVLDEIWPAAPRATDVKVTDDVITFRLDGHTAAISLQPEPIPRGDLEGPCAAAWYWPEAAAAVQGHQAHLVVGVLPVRPLDRIEIAMLLTRVVAAVARAAGAAAIYWTPGRLVHSPGAFLDYARQMTREHLPLYLWIDFGVGRDADGSYSLATSGMEALGQMEIEIAASRDHPRRLLDRLFNIAHYVLDKGLVLKPGETIGMSDEERIPIEHAPSFRDATMTVVRLEMP